MTRQLFWGDLHSHCSISYGQGTLAQALLRARQQLDFCSITGHAFWPDMPVDRARYGEIIDYHREGFARLAGNWQHLLDAQRAATRDGELIVFPSYEWHSLKYGDHNVYAAGPELPLLDAPDLPGLRAVAARSSAMLIPHHIGYAAGFRGIDWRHFDAALSPLVEIYSLHGASLSEASPRPMLHDMGPRDAASTAVAGWNAGHRFGLLASTDHHGGYPGSYGDGRVGVYAEALTRESLWSGLWARRTLAVTGDKIDARLHVDGAWIGESIRSRGARRIVVDVAGLDAVDRVELLKNERVIARWHPVDHPLPTESDALWNGRLRIDWGWGRKREPATWRAALTLSDGVIEQVAPCFSGHSVVAPRGVGGHDAEEDHDDLPHQVCERSERRVQWQSITSGNLSTQHATYQSLSLQIAAPPRTRVIIETDDGRFEHALSDLQAGGRVHYQRGWLSPALRVGPFVAASRMRARAEWNDEPELPVDRYRLQVAQVNGQWAWTSPIWVDQD